MFLEILFLSWRCFLRKLSFAGVLLSICPFQGIQLSTFLQPFATFHSLWKSSTNVSFQDRALMIITVLCRNILSKQVYMTNIKSKTTKQYHQKPRCCSNRSKFLLSSFSPHKNFSFNCLKIVFLFSAHFPSPLPFENFLYLNHMKKL